MSVEGFAVREKGRLAWRLTGIYSRWLLGYLLAVLVLWIVGIEAIYQHPTPFYAYLSPAFKTLWAHAAVPAAATVFLAAVAVTLQRIRWFDEEPSPRATAWLLVGLVFFAFVFAGTVAALRDGFSGISQAYERYQYEYISDIGFGGSIRGLFAQYLDRHQFLSMHAKVHPPGPIVVLWLLSYVAGRDALGLSLATMAVGSLGVVPLYFWVKEMLDRHVALTAAMVYVLVPSVVLFTATSADILFMPFLFLTLFLFWRALHRASLAYAVGAGVMYAVLSLLSFSLISVGAFFGFVGLWRLLDRRHRFAVFQTAVAMLAAFLVLHVLVRAWSGFDVVKVFWAAKAQFDEDQVQLDLVTPRYPAWTFRFLNPLAWAYFAGIPVTILFVWRLIRPEPGTRALFVVFALTLIALNLLYLARGEGERSALYVFPFLVIPAAQALHAMGAAARSRAPLLATLAFLAFQCWLTETLFYTYW